MRHMCGVRWWPFPTKVDEKVIVKVVRRKLVTAIIPIEMGFGKFRGVIIINL
jgi:hypothetical protein